MATEISEKSTKNQILQAYTETLAKLKEQKQDDRKADKKKDEENKIVKQASDNSVEKIVTGIGTAKIEIMSELDNVSEKLSLEFKKLEDIKKAIEIENNYLNEIYEIKTNTDTLSALLTAQKDKRTSFDAEMENKKTVFEEEMMQKRILWKQEQESYENSKKERENQLKKERQREDEEYNYNLQLNRKKEIDTYEQKKVLLEKELHDKKASVEKDFVERESTIAEKEKGLAELEVKVEQFPKQLENAIKETEKSVLEKIEFKYKHQSELEQKEIAGERNLNKQMILSLENKIKEQAEQIKQLSQKVNEASQQVQTIAIKAIESAAGGTSSQRMFTPGYERTNEQQKKGTD